MTIRRGRRPKPANLRLVTGSHRDDRHGEMPSTPAPRFPPLRKPPGLRGIAAKAWKRYIDPAGWLDLAREPAAIAFCELWAEFNERPASFPAAKHSQMRAYMGELGLTDERNRGVVDQEPADEFFGD